MDNLSIGVLEDIEPNLCDMPEYLLIGIGLFLNTYGEL